MHEVPMQISAPGVKLSKDDCKFFLVNIIFIKKQIQQLINIYGSAHLKMHLMSLLPLLFL